MSSSNHQNGNDDDKQPPKTSPFRITSEKHEIADRLNRGERVSQRSSGAIDCNELSASQPNQPPRESAATASPPGSIDVDDSSTFSDSAADLIDTITRPTVKGLYSRNSSKNVSSSDANLQKSHASFRPSAQQPSSSDSRSLQMNASRSDRQLVTSKAISSQGQSGRSNILSMASVPSMVPLRRNQHNVVPQDTASLLHPNQRLVKVQPTAGQRQPGAYTVDSQRRNLAAPAPNGGSGTAPLSAPAVQRGDQEQPTVSSPSHQHSGETSLTAYGTAGESITDGTFVMAPFRPPVFGNEDNNQKPSKRRLYWIIGGVMLVLVIGLGAGLAAVFSGESSSDKNKGEVISEMNLSPAPTPEPTIEVEHGCTLTTFLEECSHSNIFSTVEVPSCLQDRYGELLQDVVPNVLGLDSVPDSQSCEPDNLALLSMALHTTNETTDEALSTRFGLSTFYFATGGADWYENTNWITDANPCDWFRVKCSYTTKPDAVAMLSLNGNNLTGTLPSSWLRHLPDFAACVLRKNSLTGTVSPDFASLVHFDIGKNRLDGVFPFQSFADSTSMYSLSIGFNKFAQMVFPPSFTGTQWELIDLDSINFDPGPFPTQILLMPKLRSLRLANIKIVGTIPSAIGNLEYLQDLALEGNALNGPLPTELGNLVDLTIDLTFERNELTGTLPSELGRLTKLAVLKLYSNELTGTMPTELGNLKKLNIFVFDDNSFDGVIPDEVCDLKAKGTFRQFGSPDNYACAEDFGGLTCPNEECCYC